MNEICAQCHHFTLQDSPHASDGIGRCLGYGPDHPEQFVRWDRKATLLFGRAPDMAKRVQFVEMRKRKEAANAAPA